MTDETYSDEIDADEIEALRAEIERLERERNGSRSDTNERASKAGAFAGEWLVRGAALAIVAFALHWALSDTSSDTSESVPAWGELAPVGLRHEVQVGEYGIIRVGGVVKGSVFDSSGDATRRAYLDELGPVSDEGKSIQDGVTFCVLLGEGDNDAMRAYIDVSRSSTAFLHEQAYSRDVARAALVAFCPTSDPKRGR